MLVSKVRELVQGFSFLLLTYGGRVGIKLGNSVPCFSCPYVSGCGGNCFLMFFQRAGVVGIAGIAGIGEYDNIMNFVSLKIFFWLGVFVVAAALLSKFWCGWICPFGSLLDVFSAIRHKLGIREIQFTWLTRDRIRIVKYIFLGIIIVVPILIALEILPRECYILFCKICPARPIMPLFVGNSRYFGLDYSNALALTISIIGVLMAAITVVGSFFKDRFFCLFCPMLPLLQACSKISPISFEKDVNTCCGCGNCQRNCPMDIRRVHEEKEVKNVLDEDCILCLQCIESCPVKDTLSISIFKKKIFSSSKEYLLKKFRKKVGDKDERYFN